MRELDRLAIAGGMPGCVLMENAGRAVAHEALEVLAGDRSGSVVVVCGTGNNGGDGFVAARHLALAGRRVMVAVAGDADRIAGDAAVNFRLACEMGLEIRTGSAWLGEYGCPHLQAAERSALVVDALLGTGAHGEPRGAVAEAIAAIGRLGAKVVSVDMPSGVDADTGHVAGAAVHADVTVTFGYPKPGLLIYPGAGHVGRLVVDQIGFDWSRLAVSSDLEWFDEACARSALPVRAADAHKGRFGHVLVVGGCESMPGAPALTARAALRSGAGLVTVGVPRCVHAIVASHQPDYMCLALPDAQGCLSGAAAAALKRELGRVTVVCAGPGLSLAAEAQEAVRWILAEASVPVVADADALAAVAAAPELVNKRTAATVLTPHPGECARLLGTSAESVQRDRLAAAREAARTYGCVVVLKGARTIVCGPLAGSESNADGGLRTAIVTGGNPGMATGGSGDVLTGVIGALIGQGLDAFTAAALGAYIHAGAGDQVASRWGQHGLMASDLTDGIAAVMRSLTDGAKGED